MAQNKEMAPFPGKFCRREGKSPQNANLRRWQRDSLRKGQPAATSGHTRPRTDQSRSVTKGSFPHKEEQQMATQDKKQVLKELLESGK